MDCIVLPLAVVKLSTNEGQGKITSAERINIWFQAEECRIWV
jgi:hypothetical protein